ncbi:hypothetical protein [Herpetosiphon gulosus]|uniref:Carboxypeptidase regulatory-like domain-containing protein n=1 Tax=Herpetosiphon gulosus TaxID=1973496 RepID=A0ABP9WXN6_9CHLR
MTNYEYLDLNTLEQLLSQNQNNLQILEVQLAEHGVSKPVYLVNQRNTTKNEIAAIQVAINQRKNQATQQPSQQQTGSSSNMSERTTMTQSKTGLTEPKAIIKGAWIGAAAVIIAAIIGILKFMPNDTFNYQVEVIDNTTNKPISQAKVSITLPNLAPLEAFSDNNGFARISISDEYNQQAGRLSIEKAGYDSAMFNVDIQADRLPKQIKLTSNQSNIPQPTATPEPTSAGGATTPLLIGCWNNDSKPRNITNINIRESASGIKVGFKTSCADSAITDELDAFILADNQITLSKAAETWVFSLRPEGTLRLAIEGQTGFEELTFYKK